MNPWNFIAKQNLNEDKIVELIDREEAKLKNLSKTFHESSLVDLQLKLINALQGLLNLIRQGLPLDVLVGQINRILALYIEIDSKVSQAERRQRFNQEIEAQQFKAALEMLLAEQSKHESRKEDTKEKVRIQYYLKMMADAEAAAIKKEELDALIEFMEQQQIEAAAAEKACIEELLNNIHDDSDKIVTFSNYLEKLNRTSDTRNLLLTYYWQQKQADKPLLSFTIKNPHIQQRPHAKYFSLLDEAKMQTLSTQHQFSCIKKDPQTLTFAFRGDHKRQLRMTFTHGGSIHFTSNSADKENVDFFKDLLNLFNMKPRCKPAPSLKPEHILRRRVSI